jgi:hypothetical protein
MNGIGDVYLYNQTTEETTTFSGLVAGEVVYLKGTESASEPTKPPVPGEHLLIGDYILVVPNLTQIEAIHIGAEWTPAIPSSIEFTSLSWNKNNSNPVVTINFTVKDQYNCAVRVGTNALTCVCECIDRDGTIRRSGDWEKSVSFTLTNSGTLYYNPNLEEEVGPGVTTIIPLVTFQIAHGSTEIINVFVGIYLLNADGSLTLL